MGNIGQSNYAATKAHIATFAEGLSGELGKQGIDVLNLAPGPVKTEMVSEFDITAFPVPAQDVDPVVREAFDNLGRKTNVLPGWANKILGFVGKYFMPRSVNTWMMGKITKKVIEPARQGQLLHRRSNPPPIPVTPTQRTAA